jgi:hypothetical protein
MAGSNRALNVGGANSTVHTTMIAGIMARLHSNAAAVAELPAMRLARFSPVRGKLLSYPLE